MQAGGGETSYDTLGYYVYTTEDPATGVNNFDRPYLGFNLGVNSSGMKYTDTVGTTATVVNSSDLSFAGGFFGGVGTLFDEFYLGLDANFRYAMGGSTHELQDVNGTGTTNINDVHETWSTGLGAKVGGVVYNTALVYVYAGGQYTNFKLNDMQDNNGAAMADMSKSKFGMSVGMGVSVELNPKCNFDMRYLYQRYSTIEFPMASSETMEIQPTDNIFLFGFSYHFQS
jgi:opacity protein-like surface antigen